MKVYSALFITFYRLAEANWEKSMNEWKAVTVLTFAQGAWLVFVLAWLYKWTQMEWITEISWWVFASGFIAVGFINYKICILDHRGDSFLEDYLKLSSGSRMLVILKGLLALGSSVAAIFLAPQMSP